ncbi:MAG: hypothetical protein AB1390_07225 [Nitrospirota bacterium]
MAYSRIITYECEQCGSEIVVSETFDTQLSPIYCCGIEVTEVSSAKPEPIEKKKVKPKKKVTKKITAKKKKPAAKKKTSKK